MHTCLQTSSPLNKRPCPSFSIREREGEEGALSGPAPQLPAPAPGEQEEKGRTGRVRWHGCGLEGCKGHRGNEVNLRSFI